MSQTLKVWVENSNSVNKNEIAELFSKILFEVHHHHQKGEIFRMLSPENIELIDDGSIRIISKTDFEPSCYTAPELFEDPAIVSQQLDIYSLGMILYEMLNQTNFWEEKGFKVENFKAFLEHNNTGI